MSERNFQQEEKDALVSLLMSRCTYQSHHFEGTKFLICVCVAPNGMVLASGYAQREEGEFIREVAYEYAMQNARESATMIMNRANTETLLKIVNG